jgi:hypothetical protein
MNANFICLIMTARAMPTLVEDASDQYWILLSSDARPEQTIIFPPQDFLLPFERLFKSNQGVVSGLEMEASCR